MKPSEIRNMTNEEIIRTLAERRDEHFKLRMRRSTEELPNPLRLRMLRREIARLETILRERGIKGIEKPLPDAQESKK